VKRGHPQLHDFGNKEQLFNLAKGEKDESLKREAIRQLGLVGGQNELQQLYQSNRPPTSAARSCRDFSYPANPKASAGGANRQHPELRRAAIATWD
jgi:hypothetical protein